MVDPRDQELIDSLRRASAKRTTWSVREFAERFAVDDSDALIHAAEEIDYLYAAEKTLYSRDGACSSLIWLFGLVLAALIWDVFEKNGVAGFLETLKSLPIWMLSSGITFSALLRAYYKRNLRINNSRACNLNEQWFAPYSAIYSPRGRLVTIYAQGLDFPS